MLKERTLAILKPDCVNRKLVGKVLDRILEAEFKILGMKMVKMDAKMAGEFYKVHSQRPFYRDLVEFMSSGSCIPMVLEKENAIEDFRRLIGATDPAEAEPGTIRQKFAENKQNNIVHGSDSPETAITEIAFFFSESELIPNM
ncbi:nucleoside-diphosphate kinase [candidate division KSB1 bacterium]|nr:MAG: nucleoside-diphosphate kinase [candidate division KSB1 bacterium]